MNEQDETEILQQATLTGESMEVPDLDCELYGGACGSNAEYSARMSGNEYVDGGRVVVCESCLDEIEDGLDSYHELTEREVFELAE